jgi:sulfite reductase beta subunit-like hemoprotein
MQDPLGWHEQGDGKLFCGIRVENGRIKDEGDARYRTGLCTLAQRFKRPTMLTASQNMIICDIDPADRDEFDQTMREFGIVGPESFTQARRMSMACVALPTCGLALSESERVFTPIMDQIDEILRDLGLENESILFRMTGCPNGCARPYNADFGFVGRGPGKYAVFVGGSHIGDRLAGLERKTIKLEEIPALVRDCLEEFVRNRQAGESFTDYWGRTHHIDPTPDPAQFHLESADRCPAHQTEPPPPSPAAQQVGSELDL